MIKRLYQKSLKLAAHKSSKTYLAIISFVESSFFPIPPDVMIAPMVIAKKNDYLKIFLIATIFSTLGGFLGYFIGLSFSDVAMHVVEFYGYENKVDELKYDFSIGDGRYIWIATLFLAGFTPLPFKVFTITSGMIGFNLFIFFFICLISRGLRFFIVSYLSFKFGDTFNKFMETKAAKWFYNFRYFNCSYLWFEYILWLNNMPKIKYQRFLNLILFFCIFALISAYFIQYILGHQPCNLCLIERVPYISAVIIILLCFYLKKFEKICLIFLSLIFFLATIVSFYHFGIEQGFIKRVFSL